MRLVTLHDRDEIESRLGPSAAAREFSVGELDDFFWPSATWFGLVEGEFVHAAAVLYTTAELPMLVLLGLAGRHNRTLLELISPLLPSQFASRLLEGCGDVLSGGGFKLEACGHYARMVLNDRSRIDRIDIRATTQFVAIDESDVVRFYARATPDSVLTTRMFSQGDYFGVRKAGRIASVAAIHLVSRRHAVAALCDVATDPEFRGLGFARMAAAAACRAHASASTGLDVATENLAAIQLYRSLGFDHVTCYEDFTASARLSCGNSVN
jgi:ribosomal protein S18 acetylase RimI-like enzyme